MSGTRTSAGDSGTQTGLRLLVVMPSWLGDVVMATPALRLVRSALPGALIGGLLRPGLDELLAGSDLLDQMHVDRARGVMGPKVVATRLRQHRYDTCLLLTNSFSTALIARLAWIKRRIGYDRDGRGLLLTDRLDPPRRVRPHRGFAPVSAVEYYLRAARVLVGEGNGAEGEARADARLELPVTPEQAEQGARLLAAAGVAGKEGGRPYVLLNPGANNELKRWPAERFAQVGIELAREHRLAVLVNGSPAEQDLAESIAAEIRAGGIDACAALPELGVTIGSLKEVVRRATLMVTNDTGPRHIAAAFQVPRVVLFGPTDPRWTTLPREEALAGEVEREVRLVADPGLPEEEVADDHPERCCVDRIGVEAVLEAARRLAEAAAASGGGTSDRRAT